MGKFLINQFNAIVEKLKTIPSDTNEIYFQLYSYEFSVFLEAYINGKLSQKQFEELIDLLEANDGIWFETNLLKESIHELSNYRINGCSFLEQCKIVYSTLHA